MAYVNIPPGNSYTPRQLQSAFRPINNDQFQQTQQQQQVTDSFLQPQYYAEQTLSSLPVNADIPMVYVASEHQQPGLNYALGMTNSEQPQQVSSGNMRAEASPFSLPNAQLNQANSETNNSQMNSTSVLIYNSRKYTYNYFLTNLSCSFDRDYGKFGKPYGICTLNDDRLLVSNFDHDSLLLFDIKGIVHGIYKQLSSPKDVIYNALNPSQAIVATRKDVVILDLDTKQVVASTKIKGFYPWKIQYLSESKTFAACDPSGERIIFLNQDLVEIGHWSFNDLNSGYPPNQTYQKVYPYASYFLPDLTSYVLAYRDNKCQLSECNIKDGSPKRMFNVPSSLLSYSIHVDNAKNCLIPDRNNHELVTIDKDGQIQHYRCKSIQEPYSMTFLSNGTLCVTDWSKSRGTNGGIAILSEVDLQMN